MLFGSKRPFATSPNYFSKFSLFHFPSQAQGSRCSPARTAANIDSDADIHFLPQTSLSQTPKAFAQKVWCDLLPCIGIQREGRPLIAPAAYRGRERERERERDGGTEGGMEGGREGRREGGTEGGSDRDRERERDIYIYIYRERERCKRENSRVKPSLSKRPPSAGSQPCALWVAALLAGSLC